MTVLAGWHPWETWAEHSADKPRFLIDQLIHSGVTVVSGRPEAGKTSLVAELAAAIARGVPEVLGCSVRGHGTVMVAASDPHEGYRWGDRVQGFGAPLGSVMVAHSRADLLDQLVSQALSYSPRLFVLDNVLGHLGLDESDDVRSNLGAARLHRSLDPLVTHDCSVVVVAHSSQKPYEEYKKYSKGPMGSTAYEGWARHVVHVHASGPSSRLVSIRGNDTGNVELALDAAVDGDGIIRHSMVGPPRHDARPRKLETQNERKAVGRRIVDDPVLAAMSQRAIGDAIGSNQTAVKLALEAVGATKVKGVWISP